MTETVSPWSSAFMQDNPSTNTLMALECRHIRAALQAQTSGSCLWLSCWAQQPLKLADDYSKPCFQLELATPDQLRGSFQATTSLLPIADGALNMIVLQHVLEFVDEPEALLAECARVLAGDGKLLLLGLRPFSLARLRRNYRLRAPSWNRASTWISVLRALGFRDFAHERIAWAWPNVRLHLEQSREPTWKTALANALPSLNAVFVLNARKQDLRALPMKLAFKRRQQAPTLSATAGRVQHQRSEP